MPEPLMPKEVESKTTEEAKDDAVKPEDEVTPKTGVVYFKKTT